MWKVGKAKAGVRIVFRNNSGVSLMNWSWEFNLGTYFITQDQLVPKKVPAVRFASLSLLDTRVSKNYHIAELIAFSPDIRDIHKTLPYWFLQPDSTSHVESTMGKSKQTGSHKNGKKKHIAKTWKTKRRTKDLDQIHSDMKPETAAKLLHQDVDYDVTGCAQHYCLHCA